MSISSIQKKRKTNEFTQQLLKKGIEPNNYELNRLLTEYFDNHILGMPCYKPIKQKPYEESNKKDYNHNFKTLKEDLETIYEANIEANNKAVAMQEYYDLEKNKVRNALTKLALRVENISEALKTTHNVKQYVQVFDDLYGVEYYGDAKRNIPYTTSFVDLLQKKVYTDKTNIKINKISMNNSYITITGLTSFDSYKIQGKLSKVLNDTSNDIYILSAKSLSNTNKILEIVVDLNDVIEFNTVTFKFTSSREMPCELYLSEDGENYVSVYDISSKDYIEWNFNSKAARYIKIICNKTEADGYTIINDNTHYEYYYILKNISVSKEEYESKSVFVSKLIDFDDLTNVIKLDATDKIYNNTRIDYFIGFDNEIDKIGWDAIENHEDHNLFMFEKRHKILNRHIENFSSLDEKLDLYRIYELPQNVNKNSIKVTPGYNMWSIKKYTYKTDEFLEDEFTLETGDFSDHISKCNITQLFMDCDNYDKFDIHTNTLYIMTQFISLDKSMNLFDTFIKITDDDYITELETTEIKIFLNGYEITPGNKNLYSFALRKGVNKIQIAIYCKDITATTKKLYHNINFKNLTNDVFAFVPMKYTNNVTLSKTSDETYQYYTIKNNYICVKNNPNEMIESNIEDMGYFISYYCLREDMKNYFTDNHIKFRIMAVLTSEDKNVSPELINFRITGK